MIRTVHKRTVLALLVQANGLTRLKLDQALEAEHFELLWTTTTQEAVAAYNRRHVDLLLIDLDQPLNVGWETFQSLGALHPALPIVMVTEKDTELAQTVAERVSARLEKPFCLPALIRILHLLLDQSAACHLQAAGNAPFSKQTRRTERAPREITKHNPFLQVIVMARHRTSRRMPPALFSRK